MKSRKKIAYGKLVNQQQYFSNFASKKIGILSNSRSSTFQFMISEFQGTVNSWLILRVVHDNKYLIRIVDRLFKNKIWVTAS